MKHTTIFIVFLMFALLSLSGQSSNYSRCYTDNIAKGDSVFKQGKYNEARTYFATAKQCAGGNPAVAQQKINACDEKINAQKEAAETKRKAEEAAEAKRKAEEAEARRKADSIDNIWADKAYMDIKDVVFYNSFDGKSSVGNTLYPNNITFLTPCILYEGKALTKNKRIDALCVKIYKNGILYRNEDDSPKDYSYTIENMMISSNGELNRLYLTGWGTETGQSYKAGLYRCEIWYHGKQLYSKELKLSTDDVPIIKKIDFVKVNSSGSPIDTYGLYIDIEKMAYLKPRICFDYSGKELKNKSFNMIVTDPDGNKIKSFVLYDNGKEVTIDSVRCKNVVGTMRSGTLQFAELNPWKTSSLKKKMGKWKFELYYGTGVKVAETTFTLYSKDCYVKLNNMVEGELPISAIAGCQKINITTSSTQKKYRIDIKSDDIATPYASQLSYEHPTDTMIKSDAAMPGIRVEMMTDTSFVIRWLCIDKPEKNLDYKRFTITLTNEAGSAKLRLYTPADSVASLIKLINNRDKEISISVKNETIKMVFVKGGDFVMGSTSESPTPYADRAHITHVNGFYMCKYPITQKMWKLVMGSPPAAGWRGYKDNDYVAFNITYEEAVTFVKKLNELTGRKFSIPSEAEFEYAFKGGITAKSWHYDYRNPFLTKRGYYEYVDTKKVRIYNKPNVRYSVGGSVENCVLRLVLHK